MPKVPLTSQFDETAQAFGLAGRADETGRYIVTFKEGTGEAAKATLDNRYGLRNVASAQDFEEAAVNFEVLGDADALVLPQLGVAVVSAEPEQAAMIAAEADVDSPILAVEPERFAFALSAPAPTAGPDSPEGAAERARSKIREQIELSPSAAAYLRGYRDAIENLIADLVGTSPSTPLVGETVEAAAFPETQFTWGMQATRAHASRFTGKGIRVAVLDTGMDLQHPDFTGRPIVSQSFVPGQSVQDGQGHGTHCIGTACGPKKPGVLPRYGIAHEAQIMAGKVLNNSGSGTDGWILAGINWAVANAAPVISMSLGRGASPGDPFPVAYESAARAALARGCLIVAAAGNESRRSMGIIRPVGHPASCPSVLAVGAVDSRFQIAEFSTRAINPNGGEVNIVGPGVAVRSSIKMPQRYAVLNGTSMATPHVAGCAALYAQSSAALRGPALWLRLLQTARNIAGIPPVDDGRGLVQAP